MLGRPGSGEPVLRKICAGAWLNWSVCIDLTIAMSSTTFARCGSISESSAPALAVPGERESRADIRLASGRMKAYRWSLTTSAGTGWPSYFAQLRLVVEQVELAGRPGHEQVDDPLRLRREVRRPGRSGSARARGSSASASAPARACASASRVASAILPTPTPHSRKKWRRVTNSRPSSRSLAS